MAEERAHRLLSDARRLQGQLKVSASLEAAQQALDLFRELSDQCGAAESLRTLLHAQLAHGDLRPEEALKVAKEETGKVKRSARDGRRAEALMHVAQADLHLAKAESIKALQLATEAEAFFQRDEDWAVLADLLLTVVAPAQLMRGDGKKALAASNAVLELTQQVKDPEVEARAWTLVSSSRFVSNAEDAAEAARKGIELLRSLGNKAREATAHRELARGLLGIKDFQSALLSARESLAVARSAASWEQVGAATEVNVEAQLKLCRAESAVREAEEQLLLLQQCKPEEGLDKGIAFAMSAVVVAQAALKGVDDGLEVVKRFVGQLRATDNKFGEVLMLHKLATMSPFPDYAMNTAQAALTLAQKIGAAHEEKAIKKTLTDLYVAKGKIDKAPNRREALQLLLDLSKELEKKDGDRFDDANKNLEGFWNALTQRDIEAALQKVVSKDPTGYMQFLKDHGANVGEPEKQKQVQAGSNQLKSGPREYLYASFRASGISYGPRYRCCATPFAENVNPGGAVGVLALQECSDDWERELHYNPSLLDCALQNGAATVYNQALA